MITLLSLVWVFCMITTTAVCYLKLISYASSCAYVLRSGRIWVPVKIKCLLLPKLKENVGLLSRDQSKMGLNSGTTVGIPCVSPKCCSLGTRLQSAETCRWMFLGWIRAIKTMPTIMQAGWGLRWEGIGHTFTPRLSGSI